MPLHPGPCCRPFALLGLPSLLEWCCVSERRVRALRGTSVRARVVAVYSQIRESFMTRANRPVRRSYLPLALECLSHSRRAF